MWKLAKRLYSAAVMLGAAMLGCPALLTGCVDDDPEVGLLNHASVQLAVGADAAAETGGALTEAESKLYTLRVYAFVGGRPAGHYFTDNVTMTDGVHKFYMDLAFKTAGVQKVDFYVVANEAAMELKMVGSSMNIDFKLKETTTEAEIHNIWFNNLLRNNVDTKGLPMYCEKSAELDFSNLSEETPPAGSGHENHALLQESVQFELERPMGKLGVFAAKGTGQGILRIEKLTIRAEGTLVRNYIAPQTDETLKKIMIGNDDIGINTKAEPVTATIAEGATEEYRRNPANYTPVMDQAYYPFVNPYPNGGSWEIPGAEGRGLALEIDYEFDGDRLTRMVYLPRIERNHYYAVCCLIHNEGRITVTYNIADWNLPPTDEGYNGKGEYEIDFNYPDYDNPLMPADGKTLADNEKYPQPTVWFNPDEESEEGSYTFRFNIDGPVNLQWFPVMEGATANDFSIRVYQTAQDGTRQWKDFTEATETKYDDCIASRGNPYYIIVKARNPETTFVDQDNKTVEKTMKLGISYSRSWHPEGSALLLINGLTDLLRWEGSDIAEYVVIKQIEAPTNGQNTEMP